MTINGLVAFGSAKGDPGFVELSGAPSGKRLFKKQILKIGQPFVHPANPGAKITVDKAMAETLKRNFEAGVADIVQVPIVDGQNRHTEDPTRNLGRVVGLSYDDKGVYATIDAAKHADDLGKTLLGASALMHMNYSDTATGEKKGPTLLHVAITNRPYITNLSDFEEIVAASAGGMVGQPTPKKRSRFSRLDALGVPLSGADTAIKQEAPTVLVPATATETPSEEDTMDLDQMLSALKTEHGIDVPALQQAAAATDPAMVAALSNVLGVNQNDDQISLSDVAEAVVELAEEKVALSGQVQSLLEANEALAQREAEAEVDSLIKAGRILPKQREVMVALSRSDRDSFDALVPDDSIVSLSAVGVDTHETPEKGKQMQADIDRLAALANGDSK
jgi:hypothetical protein